MRDVDAFLSRVVQATLVDAKQKQKQALTTRPSMLTQLDCHHDTVHAFKRHCLQKMPNVRGCNKNAKVVIIYKIFVFLVEKRAKRKGCGYL